MKITETILLIGLGGVIAYLAFGRKGNSTEKSLGGSGGFSPDLRSIEAVDVIEPQAPINVNITNTQPTQPTRDTTAGTSTGGGASNTSTAGPSEPVKPSKSVPATESFMDEPRKARGKSASEKFIVLDNTQFPISLSYNDDYDIDSM